MQIQVRHRIHKMHAVKRWQLAVCFLFIQLCTPLHVYSQQSKWLEHGIDNYLLTMETDTEKAYLQLQNLLTQIKSQTPPDAVTRLYATIALHYLLTNQLDKFEPALQQLEEQAYQHGSKNSLVESLAVRVQWLIRHDFNETYEAIVELESHLKDVQQPRLLYYANNLVGRYYLQDTQFELAGKYLYNALDALNDINDERTFIRKAFLQGQLAKLHADMKNWPLAEEFVKQAIFSIQKAELAPERAAEQLLMQGYIQEKQGHYEAAIVTYNKAIQLVGSNNRDGVVLMSLNNIGATNIKLERYDAAIEAFSQAKKLAKQLDELSYQLVLFNLGYIDVKQGRIDIGINQMRTALAYFRSNTTSVVMEIVLAPFADALRDAGLHHEEAKILREQQDLINTLFQSDRERIVTEAQQRFQARERAHQIIRLEQANALQDTQIKTAKLQKSIIMLSALLAIVSGVLLWRLNRKSQQMNSQLYILNKQLEYQSLHDPLTGLDNRRSFKQQMVKRSQNKERHSLTDVTDAIILLDIDFFKKINDRFGHAVGDQVLVEMAIRLNKYIRDNDSAIRWGGEEFLIYLQQTKLCELDKLVQRLLFSIAEKPFNIDGQLIMVTVTAGFITLPFSNSHERELDWEKALRLADVALYIGKAQGRNQACGVIDLHVPLNELLNYSDQKSNLTAIKKYLSCSQIQGPAAIT